MYVCTYVCRYIYVCICMYVFIHLFFYFINICLANNHNIFVDFNNFKMFK